MATLYHDADARLERLAARPIAVLRFGSQGHAHAFNLRDAGLDMRVGLPSASRSRAAAERAGLYVLAPAASVREAQLVALLVPDHLQPAVYHEAIAPHLAPGATLRFAHRFAIHFGEVVPRADFDVVIVAPKAPGHRLREVLCGGVSALVKAGFETLVEHDYQPDLAYFECLHELKLIVDLMYQGGLSYTRHLVSDTAEYGDYVAGDAIVTAETCAAMRRLLAAVRDGTFARQWMAENWSGQAELERRRALEAAYPIVAAGGSAR